MWRIKPDFELLFSILDYCTVQIKRHRFSTKTDSGIFLFNHILPVYSGAP